MSEMIDRVADSVRAAFTEAELNNPRVSFKELTDILARAAIEAMLDPSWDMMQAMYEAMFADKWDGTQAPMVGAGFDAAIDAALSSQPLEMKEK